MSISELLNIKVLPYGITQSLYSRLDNNAGHLSYKNEKRIFACIKAGDAQSLFNELRSFDGSINVGSMSADSLRQYKYMAVSCITIATRYAIDGGLREADAYGFSDIFIRKIDEMDSPEQITEEIARSIIRLTNSVAEEKSRLKYSPYVRKCIIYINKNINKKITIKDLAEECGLSSDYLSHLFNKEMDERLSEYVLRVKLEIACQLLAEGLDNSKIAGMLGFSSPSHFISVFKKQYGITPKKFLMTIK